MGWSPFPRQVESEGRDDSRQNNDSFWETEWVGDRQSCWNKNLYPFLESWVVCRSRLFRHWDIVWGGRTVCYPLPWRPVVCGGKQPDTYTLTFLTIVRHCGGNPETPVYGWRQVHSVVRGVGLRPRVPPSSSTVRTESASRSRPRPGLEFGSCRTDRSTRPMDHPVRVPVHSVPVPVTGGTSRDDRFTVTFLGDSDMFSYNERIIVMLTSWKNVLQFVITRSLKYTSSIVPSYLFI